MPMRSAVNQYLGPNAHFLSYCQSTDKNKRKRWEGFHDAYIHDIQRTLGVALEPYGYAVDNTTSLQVREYNPESNQGADRFHAERSDLGILHDANPDFSYPSPAREHLITPGILTLPIPDTFQLNETEFLHALAIRDIKQTDDFNKIVTWIELLSPSNKPGGADARDYLNKRLTLIAAEIPLIEIDFLHKQASVIAGIPLYRPGRGQVADAKPYLITVTDPRPDASFGGYTRVFSFAVDEPFPMIPVPLLGEFNHPFDFGVPFNQTFALTVHHRLVDYEQLPEDFDSYQSHDQAAIQLRMRIIHLHRHELEQGPFPIADNLTLKRDNLSTTAKLDDLET